MAVKEAVFPFNKLPGVDLILGPEMRSTGEVMGIADSFGMAFAKAQIAADGALPLEGAVFVTVNDHDKHDRGARSPGGSTSSGFRIVRHRGHRAPPPRPRRARRSGCSRCTRAGPTRSTCSLSGEVQLLINTPLGKLTQQDDYLLRRAALQHRVPYTTTMSAASAACDAIIALRSRAGDVRSLQEWHELAREADRGNGVTTARDPGVRRGAPRRWSGARCASDEPLARYSTYRIGGPATVLLPAANEDVGAALRLAAARGVPWFAVGLGSNLLLPDEGLDALVIRLGKGLDRLDRDGDRWTVGAGLPAPLAARRTAAGGLVRAPQVRGRAGHGGRRRLHERRLSRRRMGGCRGVGDGGGRRPGATPCSPAPRSRSPTGGAGSRGRWCSRPPCALRAEDPAVIEAELAELFRWRSEGTPFNQPCCGSVFRNPGGAALAAGEGGPGRRASSSRRRG